MTVIQKQDECEKYPVRNRVPLSLSLDNSGKGALSNVLKQDSVNNTDTVYPVKRKTNSPLPKNTKKLNFGTNMFNGYRSNDDNNHDSLPVATLSNMGNTCYLNSVLYTLRFTPAFLHNLHHLVVDLTLMHTKINQTKAKSSSLGRNISGISGPSNRSSSSKDLLSLGSINDLCPKSKMQIMTEKLHELFVQLHSLEMKDNNDSYQPSNFLQALIEINSLYHGNQQQDAHELLVNLLDILRETCEVLTKQSESQVEIQSDLIENETAIGKSWTVRRTKKKGKETKKKSKESDLNGESDQSSAENIPIDKPKKNYNFISENFSGVTLLRTKCIECESVTERKEPFYDICVPITTENDFDMDNYSSDIYKYFCVTSENLRDTNKYWCDYCVRYNEACNEVSYERLPNLLVLQLKRFSQSANGMEKINNYMPTPLVLDCFCNDCSKLDDKKLHTYQLYSVIMHLGATIASGHYIAYTRASDYHYDYCDCVRENPKGVNFSSGTSDLTKNFLKFFKPKLNASILSSSSSESLKSGLNNNANKNGPVPPTICKSKDCCGIKMSKSVIENAINNSTKGKNSKFYDNDQLWLECDDDVVRTLSTEEFQNLLSFKKNSLSTPYLLFYSRIKENSSSSSSSE